MGKIKVMHGQMDAEAAAESEEHVSFHELHEQNIRFKNVIDTHKDCKVVGKIKVTHGRTDADAAAESEEHVHFMNRLYCPNMEVIQPRIANLWAN
jgi:hypothetical protein